VEFRPRPWKFWVAPSYKRRPHPIEKMVAVQKTLYLRVLGEIELRRGERVMPLPPSKKTRALLAYLAISGRPHRRERLCSLFWDVTDDPRGALRWSLSKLRALVDEKGRPRIVADRDTVTFHTAGAMVDLLAVREALATGLDGMSTDTLLALASEFRGEFLEGLDLGGFLEFQAWCVAEREEACQLQTRILRALVHRVRDRPEEALRHARALVRVDPLDEQARAVLVELLRDTGRHREAEEQYRAGRRVLEELGAPLSGVLEDARRSAARVATATPDTPATTDASPARGPEAPEPPTAPPALVGRQTEMARLYAILDAVHGDRHEQVVLLTGEPGVGKSRLLAEVLAMARGLGGTVLDGRAYEVEATRPYGPWIDALRRLGPLEVGPTLGADLAVLLPEHGRADEQGGTRERLFGAVVDLLAARAHAAAPVVLAIDDLQWCDAASAALLHYSARMSRHRPILVLLAARAGELTDNVAASRTLAALRRETPFCEIRLGPLQPAETEALVRSIAPGADFARAHAESGGNPLFAIEAARAFHRRDDAAPTLSTLVRERVARLSPEAAHLLRWAAVLGPTFTLDRLLALVSVDEDTAVTGLEVLERHALVRPDERAPEPREAYVFAHDVVRQAVYGELSGPRRRLMHRRAAAILEAADAGDDVAAEIAHHAALAGDAALAARACVAAGRRCLHIFANAEAEAFVRRGMRHAEGVADPERVMLQVELQQIAVAARRPERIDETARDIERLAEHAVAQGATKHARLAFHMVGWLRWEHGEWTDAQRFLLQAERVSRGGDDRDRAVAMAEAARCLALLQRDLGDAEALLLEAGALARRFGCELLAVADGLGMLRMHQGRVDEAHDLFARACDLARSQGDRDGEFQALAHRVMLEIERERWREAAGLADELTALAAKLRGGSEGAFARALAALCARAAGSGDGTRLDASIEELQVADAKHRLAFVLTRAAELARRGGDPAAARVYATAALQAAEALDAPSEMAEARAALAGAAAALGDAKDTERHLDALRGLADRPLSARARIAFDAALGRKPAPAPGGRSRRRSRWNTSLRKEPSTIP
jgi:DNA-binding SARP family transcriptional activator